MRTLLTLIVAAAFTLPATAAEGDSALVLKPEVARYSYDAIPKDPLASAFFSATIPGSGQVYNKEYGRGIITGLGFYIGFYAVQYYIARWQEINTDTVYFRQTDQYGDYYGQVQEYYVARPADKQVGLPTGEKVALGVSLAAVAGFWVFGVVDAYRGAERYNHKLNAAALDSRPLTVAFDYKPENSTFGVKTKLRF